MDIKTVIQSCIKVEFDIIVIKKKVRKYVKETVYVGYYHCAIC